MALFEKKKSSTKKSSSSSLLTFDSWLYSIYITVICFVSIIVIAITLWITLSSIWSQIFISDDEYLHSDGAWEIRQCSEPRWIEEKQESKTPEEIATCKQEAETSALATRSVRFKETLIWAWSTLIVFMILFSFHYPKFLKNRREKK